MSNHLNNMKNSPGFNPNTGPTARPAFDQGFLGASDDQDVHMTDAPLTINPYQMHLQLPVIYEDDTFHVERAATYDLYVQANSVQVQTVFAPVLPPPHLNDDLTTAAPVQSNVNPYFHSLTPINVLSPTLAPDAYLHSVMTLTPLMLSQNHQLTNHPIQNAPPRKIAVPVSVIQRLEGLRQQQCTRRPCHRLETLPAEIRLIIYAYVFKGAELEVSPSHLTRGRCSPNDWLSPYRLITKGHTDLIRTSRFFFHEALPSLVRATTLEVWWVPSQRGVDPLHYLPDDFLSMIETIKVEFNAFVHIKRIRLPKLKQVDLFHGIDSPGGFADAIHIMNCQNCGGMPLIVKESFAGSVFSWRWKQRQYAYLGRLEGFTVNMTAVWEVWCPVPGMARIVRASIPISFVTSS